MIAAHGRAHRACAPNDARRGERGWRRVAVSAGRTFAVLAVVVTGLAGALATGQPTISSPGLQPVADSGVDLYSLVNSDGLAAAGGVADFTVSVVNATTASSAGAITVSLLPSGAQASGANAIGSGWVCATPADSCTTSAAATGLATLPALHVHVPVAVGVDGAGYVGLRASVRTSDDLVTGDDVSQAQTPVVDEQGTDLALTATSTDMARLGQQAPFQLTVRNLGGTVTTGPVRVAYSVNGNATSDSAPSGAGWTCPAGADECTLDHPLAAGQAAAPLAVGVPTYSSFGYGTYVGLSAHLTGQADSFPANDSASASAPMVRSAVSELAISASPAGPATVGGQASFNVQVRNQGGASATAPLVVDLRASGAVATSQLAETGTGWACPGDGTECTYTGSLASGASAPDLTVAVAATTDTNAPGVTSLSATIQDSEDGVEGNESASASTPVRRDRADDLALSIGGDGAASPSGTGHFTLAVANLGGSTAAGPVRVGLGPAGRLASASVTGTGTGWTCPGDGRECVHPGDVAAGAQLPLLHLSVDVADDPGQPSSVGMSASFTAVQGKQDNDNGYAELPVGGTVAHDLGVVVGPAAPVAVGAATSSAVTVVNVGAQALAGRTSVALSGLPSGSTASGSSWVCSPGLQCDYTGTIASGGSAPALTVITPTGSTASAQSVGVLAQVSNATDQNPRNDGGRAAVGVGALPADLTVDLQGPGPVAPGQTASFIAHVRNAGTATTSSPVTARLYAPRGSTASGDGWTCTGTLSCTSNDAVDPGDSLADLTVVAPAPSKDADGSLLVQAYLVAADDGTPSNDSTSAEAGIGVVPTDLSVRVQDQGPTPTGSAAHDTMVVSNTGWVAATAPVTVHVYDSAVDASASGSGWSCTTDLACTSSADVAPGASLPAIDVSSPLRPEDPVGVVSVNADLDSTQDGYTRNDFSGASGGTGSVSTDLSVALASASPFRPGMVSRVAAVVRNTGSKATTGSVSVSLGSPYPGAVATGEGWSCTAELDCEYDDQLAPGAAAPELNLDVKAPADTASGQATVYASLSAQDDQNTRSSSGSLTLPTVASSGPAALGVELVRTDGSGPLSNSASPTFSLTVANHSSAGVSAPTVTVNPSFGLTTTALAGAGWTCSGMTCTYAVGLQPGEQASLGFGGNLFDTQASRVFLTANASWSGPAAGHASQTRAMTVADRGVDLAPVVHGTAPATAGTQAQFRLAVRNVGGDDATKSTEVRLSISGPVAGDVVASGSGWRCPARTLRCVTQATVAARRSLPDLIVSVPLTPETSSSVSLSATVGNDLDVEHDDDYSSGTVPVVGTTLADLALSATATSTAAAGGQAGFDVTVRNVGAATRPGPVRVHLDYYPGGAGTGFASGSGWVCPGDVHECDYAGDVAAGQVLPALHLTPAVPASLTDYSVNQVTARIVGASDAVPSNDSATVGAPVTGTDRDLALSAAAVGAATAGTAGTFVVRLANLGSQATTGPVRVSLSPGGGQTLGTVTASGTGWSCPDEQRECVYTPSLAAHATAADLTVTVPLAAGITSVSSTVGLTASLLDDPMIAGNNTAVASTPIVAATAADPAVAVRPDGAATYDGSGTFVVAVRNVGRSAAGSPIRVDLSSGGARSGASLTSQGSGWSCPGDGTQCTYTGSAAAGSALPDLRVSVPTGPDPGSPYHQSLVLYASLTANDDAMPGDDSGNASSPLVRPASPVDISVRLTPDAPAERGTAVAWQAVVTNSGTASDPGPITVTLDAPQSGATAGGPGWTCDGLTCRHSGALGAGASLSALTLRQPTGVDAYPGTLTASASVDSAAAPGDEVTTQASTSVGGAQADLTVQLGASAPQQTGSGTQSFVATVANHGAVASSGPVTVTLSASLPGETASGSGWVCTTQLVCTSQSSVAAGGTLPALTLSMPVPAQDAFSSNAATAYVSGGSDTLANNDSAESTSGVGGLPVDVTVRMTAPTPGAQGGHVLYTAVVSNSGSAAGSGVITVALQSPFAAAVASGSGWSCSSQLVCDHPGGIAAGAQLPVLTLDVDAPDSNSAGVATAGATVSVGSDRNTRNNYAAASSGTGGLTSDLIVQVGGEAALVAGESTTAFARVTNVGSASVPGNVVVQLSAPNNPVVTGTGWVCSSSLVCQHSGPLAAGASLPDLTLTLAVPADATPASASISANVSNASDQDTYNNSDSTTLPVVRLLGSGAIGSAYVALSPTSADTFPGGEATLQVQLNGSAPLSEQPATLSLTLPAGLDYAAGSSQGLPEPGGTHHAPVWQVTMPAEGETLNASVNVTVAASRATGVVDIGTTLTAAGDVQESIDTSLNVVSPTLESANPGTIGTATSVSVSFNGRQLQPTFQYQLVHGSTVLTAGQRNGATGNVVGTFDTSSTPLGSYDARVTGPGGLVLTLANAVTLAEADPSALSVDLQGPTRVRLNAPGRYYATVTNGGNVDAYDVPIVLTVPTGVDVTVGDSAEASAGKAVMAAAIDAMTSDDPGPDQLSPADAAEVKQYIETMPVTGQPDPVKPVQYIMASVPYLAPGATATAAFLVTPRQQVTAPVTASVPIDTAHFAATQQAVSYDRRVALPTAGKTSLDDAMADIDCSGEYAQFCATSRAYVNGLKSADKAARSYGCVSFTWVPLVNTDCTITNPITLFSPHNVIEHLLTRKYPALGSVKKAWGVLSFVKGLYDNLIGAADSIEDGYDSVSLGVASTDPNELVGSAGSGSQRWVQPTTPLDYTVEFENVASATAAAQRVTVTDQLPPQIDPASVRVVSAEVGGVDIPVADSVDGQNRTSNGEATLAPDRTVLLDATVNAQTGLLTAHFEGPPDLDDPFSPTPYTEFLPPNVVPGEGEGSLRITAQPVAHLNDGSQIVNQAAVTFDDHLAGPTITTNTWFNTTDSTAPSAVLDSPPATVVDTAHLSWSLQDSGSGGAGATVYESVDGGPSLLANVFAAGTSADVPVVAGHAYRFAIVPVDAAYNHGTQTPWVSTTAVAAPAPPTTPVLPAQAAIQNFAAPTVTGTPRVGSTMTAGAGAWSLPATFGYQWLAGGQPLAGATGATLVVPAAAAGRPLQVQVTAQPSDRAAGTALSAASAAVQPGAFSLHGKPKLSGTPRVGSKVKVKPGAVSPVASSRKIQWYRDGKKIKHATKPTYRVTASDVGHRLSAVVTYFGSGFNSVMSKSGKTGLVKRF